jgi:CheY-like chemotaxis protein
VRDDLAAGRVLVVDDEPRIRELLRDFLTTAGDELATAATGAAALEAVPTFQPDVILLDMLMPGLSGRDVFDALRRASATVPVILIPGTPRIVEEGFFSVLRNPFDLRTIADVVAAAVNHRRSSSA